MLKISKDIKKDFDLFLEKYENDSNKIVTGLLTYDKARKVDLLYRKLIRNMAKDVAGEEWIKKIKKQNRLLRSFNMWLKSLSEFLTKDNNGFKDLSSYLRDDTCYTLLSKQESYEKMKKIQLKYSKKDYFETCLDFLNKILDNTQTLKFLKTMRIKKLIKQLTFILNTNKFYESKKVFKKVYSVMLDNKDLLNELDKKNE